MRISVSNSRIRSQQLEIFKDPLAGAPSECSPWRQDGRVVRGTGFGIQQIWTHPALVLCDPGQVTCPL